MKGNFTGIVCAKWNYMKPLCSARRNHAMTLLEVLIIVFVLALVTAMLMPAGNHASHRKAMRIDCVNNLKEVSLATRIWEGNHGDRYPNDISATNGGAMEFAATGDSDIIFQVMSNELSTPKVLFCPADTGHCPATNFSAGFSGKNISYFINLDANEANPQMVLFGDDNFELSGVPVNPGLLKVPVNTSITWSPARHHLSGNVAITDGSVQQLTISGLQQALQNSDLTTGRVLIP